MDNELNLLNQLPVLLIKNHEIIYLKANIITPMIKRDSGAIKN